MEIHSKPRSVVRNFFGTIGITKTALRKVLGKSFVDMETLNTFVAEVDMIMNDKSITYISPDINDPEPLTPSHN